MTSAPAELNRPTIARVRAEKLPTSTICLFTRAADVAVSTAATNKHPVPARLHAILDGICNPAMPDRPVRTSCRDGIRWQTRGYE